MEILLVLIVLAVIAAAAFLYMRSRGGAPGLSRRGGQGRALRGSRGGQGPALRGSRGAARASRHDPMAEAVERHAQVTDPHEAAQAERELQAQASRVAADLHAASTPETRAAPVYPDQEVFETRDGKTIDAHGRPVSVDADPGYQNEGPPAYENGRPAVYEDGTPVADDERAYYDEQGRPVHPDDRPRY